MGSCSSSETGTGAATSRREISDKELDSKTDKVPFFKVVVVGDASVGKSGITGAIVGKASPLKAKPTLEPTITNFEYKLSESMMVGISLVEMPAHANASMKRRHYRDLDGSIVVVDLSQPVTVDLCGSWKRDVITKASESKPLGGLKASAPRLPKVARSTPSRPKQKSLTGSEDGYIFSSSDGATSDTDVEVLSGIKQKGFPIVLIGCKLDLVEKTKATDNLDSDEDDLKPDIVSQLERLSLTNSFWDYVTFTPKEKVVVEKFNLKIKAFFRFLLQRRASLQLQKPFASSQHPDLPTNPQDIQSIKQEMNVVKPLTNRSENANSRSAITESLANNSMAGKADRTRDEDSYTSTQQEEKSTAGPDMAAIMTPKQRPSNPLHQFDMTGLIEHDRYLLQTEHMIARVADMKVRFEKSKVRFSEICFENSVTTSQGASIIDCLICIRDQTDLISQIVMKPDDQLFNLELDNPSVKLAVKYEKTFSFFNKQLFPVCKDINRELPMISRAFINAEEKMNEETMQSRSMAVMGMKTPDEVKQIQGVIERNLSLLFDAQQMARQTTTEVRSLIESIEQAFPSS